MGSIFSMLYGFNRGVISFPCPAAETETQTCAEARVRDVRCFKPPGLSGWASPSPSPNEKQGVCDPRFAYRANSKSRFSGGQNEA